MTKFRLTREDEILIREYESLIQRFKISGYLCCTIPVVEWETLVAIDLISRNYYASLLSYAETSWYGTKYVNRPISYLRRFLEIIRTNTIPFNLEGE